MNGTPPDDFDSRQRTNYIVLAVAIVAVILFALLMIWLKNGLAEQDCFLEGHKLCDPVPADQN